MTDSHSERRRLQRAARADRPQQAVEERHRSNFFAESWAELRKVEWPGQAQVIQGTAVVLIACLVVGVFLYINDQVWKQVVSRILLGQ
ncbi:MAG TPA: preprotein translocase subunit SecE [Gaiellaceae bacterium]|jgi:preprotein translocase SecE subunit|nr:preprotein translocase subunit SecE [Gaiellaceae bacterium]